MRVDDALPKLALIVNRPFGELFEEHCLDDMMIIAKGRAGKLLERLLGLPHGVHLTDFDDGELKTNKSAPDGSPLETMFISQISSRVDNVLRCEPFDQSWIYQKIKRLVYLPVVKVGQPAEWYFRGYYDVRLTPLSPLYSQLNSDYESICRQVVTHLNTGDQMLHTSSGRYIQIRTKDTKPYSPIFSALYDRDISNKNFAFYFKKDFMRAVQVHCPVARDWGRER